MINIVIYYTYMARTQWLCGRLE